MRKIFFLAAAMLAAVTVSAQRIEFTEVIAAEAFGTSKTISNGDVELIIDNRGGKMSVDGNKTKFGTSTADMWQSTHRLKTGGMSSVTEGQELGMTLYVPSAGVVKVYARTGSSAATRAIVLIQDGVEVLNHAFTDTEAVSDGDVKIFPIFTSEKVAEGEIDIQFGKVPEGESGNGGMFIYAIEFVSDGQGIQDAMVAPKAKKVMENGQMIIVRNGVKYNALGTVVE
ncbi:MAG: hypothetical protein SOT07_07690 [Paludibacteraceae bacterium]|nr:hypothetical protein [Paludibacteraceae bacterium]